MKYSNEDVEQWVEDLGDLLYRYALSRVYNEALAKDLVQTTFLAAIKGLEKFAGDSSPKTWLFSILKFKIIDHFRMKKSVSLDEISNLDQVFHKSFDKKGKWAAAPQTMCLTPDEILENKDFKKILWECIHALPDKLRQIFILREIDGEQADNLCKKFELTQSNFGVIIHRLRHKLRHCFFENGIQDYNS